MSPDLLETVRQSSFTPWIGGAILVIVALGLLKLVAKTGGKLIVLAVLAAVGIFGYQWWGKPSERSLPEIRQDWFASLRETDLSSAGLQALAKDTGRLLQEASAISQAKSQEALTKMASSLKEKMKEAKAKGEDDAEEQIKRLYDEVMKKLR